MPVPYKILRFYSKENNVECKVEIRNKRGIFDPAGNGIKKGILDLGIKGVKKVSVSQVFIISGDVAEADIHRISRELLVDPITEEHSIGKGWRVEGGGRVVEVAYNPGVMDPVEESTKKAMSDMGIYGAKSVRTEKRYVIEGNISEADFKTICEKLLYNRVIQHVVKGVGCPSTSLGTGRVKGEGNEYKFKLVIVDLLKADDKKLMSISKKGQLFLNLKEMQTIKKYFKKLGRNPTDCELETIAQTWSEHCAHKTFRGIIEYQEEVQGAGCRVKKIDNLLKNTIMKVTNDLKKPWCVSVFKDNAGIIRFDEESNICFKVETHNHPSALEPYGGAGTGIGGVIRDILGVGLGARPIMNTDVFCFGLPDTPFKDVPKGMLHPKRIMKGVVSGVRDYGNRMGIPTANGAVLFDKKYVGNPLVYCGTVGIMPKEASFKYPQSGDLIVVVGGRTGRDGIHGATFSSGELTHESETISSGAVQIGNAITEKKLTDTLLKARDRNLYNAITDCGAGGFSSAVGEMGEHLGAEVDLEKAPLKYQGLSYTEIWISEAQERMVLAVPKHHVEELLDLFKKEDVEAVAIGCFTSDKRLRLRYKGNVVCDLDMEFLHKGIPRFEREAVWTQLVYDEPAQKETKNLTKDLLKILASWNVASKEWVIRQYDHEVQGQSVLKPLVGIANDGPGDASIIRPKFNSKKGIIISNGINPRYGYIDPYWMAGSAIDEALRQIIAVGGSLKKVAFLDNFCWGNTDKPDRLGSLVRAAFGCYDIARLYGLPFISGKDSLNNEYAVHGESIAIPGTLLISAMSIMDDVSKAISMDFKEPGNFVYVIGLTHDELGGSYYNLIRGYMGNNVPKVNPRQGLKIFNALGRATQAGLISSCHDCSEGGIGVSLSEMAFAGGWGVRVYIEKIPFDYREQKTENRKEKRDDVVLFSESNTRFIAEVKRADKKRFEEIMKGVPIGMIGKVSDNKDFIIYGLDGKKAVESDIETLKEAWQEPLRW